MAPIKTVLPDIRRAATRYAPLQLDLLRDLTAIDSGTGNTRGISEVIQLIRQRLPFPGARVEVIDAPGVGGHLVIRLGNPQCKRKIILSAHLDTVFEPGEAARNPFRIEGEKAYGLGIADCKGGVVVSLFAVAIARELEVIPDDLEIVMLYTSDEETGSTTAIPLFEKEARDAAFAFVFEPGRAENGAVTSRLGCATGLIAVRLKKDCPQACAPGADVNLELARKVVKLSENSVPEKDLFFRFKSIRGNRSSSTAPALAAAEFSVRFKTHEEMSRVKSGIEALETKSYETNCRTKTIITAAFPPMERTEANLRAYALVKKAADQLELALPEQFSTGSSDACFFSSMGVPTVDALGPFMYDIHTTAEALKISTIQERTELFALTLALM